VKEYNTWEQIAGYFDGDGSISISDLSNQPFKLGLSLAFTDASFEQISMIRDFFLGRGIQTSNVLRTTQSAWMIAISRFDGVVRSLKVMSLLLFKKANEADAAIDYYEGRITGNEFVETLRREVQAGRRERHPHKVAINVPYTYIEGDRRMNNGRKIKLRDSFGRYRAKVTPDDFASIRQEHFLEGKRLCQLAKEYPQYARETIRRVLGGGRGYVGVKGIGRVVTSADAQTLKGEPSQGPASS
jgi:hypothetical protein